MIHLLGIHYDFSDLVKYVIFNFLIINGLILFGIGFGVRASPEFRIHATIGRDQNALFAISIGVLGLYIRASLFDADDTESYPET